MHFSSDYQQRKCPLFVRLLIHFLQSPRFGRNIKTNIQKPPTLFKRALISWKITQIEHLKHQHIQLQCVCPHLSGFHGLDFSWTILVLNPMIKLAWHHQNSSEHEFLRVKQLFIWEVHMCCTSGLISLSYYPNNSFVLIIRALDLVPPLTPPELIFLSLPPLVVLYGLQDAQELQVASHESILQQILCAQQQPNGQTSFFSAQNHQQHLVLAPQIT